MAGYLADARKRILARAGTMNLKDVVKTPSSGRAAKYFNMGAEPASAEPAAPSEGVVDTALRYYDKARAGSRWLADKTGLSQWADSEPSKPEPGTVMGDVEELRRMTPDQLDAMAGDSLPQKAALRGTKMAADAVGFFNDVGGEMNRGLRTAVKGAIDLDATPALEETAKLGKAVLWDMPVSAAKTALVDAPMATGRAIAKATDQGPTAGFKSLIDSITSSVPDALNLVLTRGLAKTAAKKFGRATEAVDRAQSAIEAEEAAKQKAPLTPEVVPPAAPPADPLALPEPGAASAAPGAVAGGTTPIDFMAALDQAKKQLDPLKNLPPSKQPIPGGASFDETPPELMNEYPAGSPGTPPALPAPVPGAEILDGGKTQWLKELMAGLPKDEPVTPPSESRSPASPSPSPLPPSDKITPEQIAGTLESGADLVGQAAPKPVNPLRALLDSLKSRTQGLFDTVKKVGEEKAPGVVDPKLNTLEGANFAMDEIADPSGVEAPPIQPRDASTLNPKERKAVLGLVQHLAKDRAEANYMGEAPKVGMDEAAGLLEQMGVENPDVFLAENLHTINHGLRLQAPKVAGRPFKVQGLEAPKGEVEGPINFDSDKYDADLLKARELAKQQAERVELPTNGSGVVPAGSLAMKNLPKPEPGKAAGPTDAAGSLLGDLGNIAPDGAATPTGPKSIPVKTALKESKSSMEKFTDKTLEERANNEAAREAEKKQKGTALGQHVEAARKVVSLITGGSDHLPPPELFSKERKKHVKTALTDFIERQEGVAERSADNPARGTHAEMLMDKARKMAEHLGIKLPGKSMGSRRGGRGGFIDLTPIANGVRWGLDKLTALTNRSGRAGEYGDGKVTSAAGQFLDDISASRLATDPVLQLIGTARDIGNQRGYDLAEAPGMRGLLDQNRLVGRGLERAMGNKWTRPMAESVMQFLSQRDPEGRLFQSAFLPADLQRSLGDVLANFTYEPGRASPLMPSTDRIFYTGEDFKTKDGVHVPAGSVITPEISREVPKGARKAMQVERDPASLQRVIDNLSNTLRNYRDRMGISDPEARASVSRAAGAFEKVRDVTRDLHLTRLDQLAENNLARARSLRNAANQLRAQATTAFNQNNNSSQARIDHAEAKKLEAEAQQYENEASNLWEMVTDASGRVVPAQWIESYMTRVPRGKMLGDPETFISETVRGRVPGRVRSGNYAKMRVNAQDGTAPGDIDTATSFSDPMRTLRAMSNLIAETKTGQSLKSSIPMIEKRLVELMLEDHNRASGQGLESGLYVTDPSPNPGDPPVTRPAANDAEASQAAYDFLQNTQGMKEGEARFLRQPGRKDGSEGQEFRAVMFQDGKMRLVPRDIALGMLKSEYNDPSKASKVAGAVTQAHDSSVLASLGGFARNAIENTLRGAGLPIEAAAEQMGRAWNRGEKLSAPVQGITAAMNAIKGMVQAATERKGRVRSGLSHWNLESPATETGFDGMIRGIKDFAKLQTSGDSTMNSIITDAYLNSGMAREARVDAHLKNGATRADAEALADADVARAKELNARDLDTMPAVDGADRGALEALSYSRKRASNRLPDTGSFAPQVLNQSKWIPNLVRFARFWGTDVRNRLGDLRAAGKAGLDAISGNEVDPSALGRIAPTAALTVLGSLLQQPTGNENDKATGPRVAGLNDLSIARLDPIAALMIAGINRLRNSGKRTGDPTMLPGRSDLGLTEAVIGQALNANTGSAKLGQLTAGFIPRALHQLGQAGNIAVNDEAQPPARGFFQGLTQDFPGLNNLVKALPGIGDGNLTPQQVREDMRRGMKDQRSGLAQVIDLLTRAFSPLAQSPGVTLPNGRRILK